MKNRIRPSLRFLILAALGTCLFAMAVAAGAPQGQIVPANKVTAVVASIIDTDVTSPDRVRIVFSARITSQSKGAVDYRWFRSDGGRGQQQRITFDRGGDLSVTTTWTIGAADAGRQIWEAVEILYPNHMESNKAGCTVPAPRVADSDLPVRLSVSLTQMSVDPNRQCPAGNKWDPNAKWIGGVVTVLNLNQRFLTLKEKTGTYYTNYFFFAVLFPLRKEVINTVPVWPHVYNDPNWGAMELEYPDTLGSRAQFQSVLTKCYPVFDKHPIIYVGAIFTDKVTGERTASNLARYEVRMP